MSSTPQAGGGEQASTESQDINENVVRIIGIVSGLVNLVALTAVSFIVFPDGGVVYPIIVGLSAGIGSYFFLPWIILANAETAQSTRPDTPDQGTGGVHVGAFGMAFEAAGIGMLALRFVVDDITLGVSAGVAIALVVYLLASALFNSQF